MTKLKDYIQLHLNILLFSLTSVFSKLASVYYNKEGLHSPLLYVFLFLMIANCGIYAIAWQQVIKKFSLSTAYANKSVYLLWSQVWAVIIFHENLSIQNIIGIMFVLVGVWMVHRYELNIYADHAGRNFFFSNFAGSAETERQYHIQKSSQGISELESNSGLWHLFRSFAPQYLVLYKSRYEIWSCNRYRCLCFCTDLFLAYPERKDHPWKNHW